MVVLLCYAYIHSAQDTYIYMHEIYVIVVSRLTFVYGADFGQFVVVDLRSFASCCVVIYCSQPLFVAIHVSSLLI